jgi:hypothetical protein
MAFQSVPNTAAVHFRATMHGENIENVIYVTAGSPYSQTDIDDIAEIADNAWATYMLAVLSQDYIYRETYVKGLEDIIDLEATDATHASDPGEIAAAAMPGNVAFAIKFQTGHTGRSARGRNFVAGLTEAAVTGNLLDSTYADAIRDAYVSIGTALNAGGYPQVVVSRYTNGAKRATGLTLPVTVISYTDLAVDSQRGRLAGRGD